MIQPKTRAHLFSMSKAKRDVVCIMLLAATVLAGHQASAQGTIDFRNNASVPVFLCNGVDKVEGTNFVAQLYWATSAAGPWTAATNPPAPFRTGPDAGIWNPGPDPVRVVGVPPGQTVFLTVRVWDATEGAFQSSISRAESAVFAMPTGGGGNPPGLPENLTGAGRFSAFIVLYGLGCPNPDKDSHVILTDLKSIPEGGIKFTVIGPPATQIPIQAASDVGFFSNVVWLGSCITTNPGLATFTYYWPKTNASKAFFLRAAY